MTEMLLSEAAYAFHDNRQSADERALPERKLV